MHAVKTFDRARIEKVQPAARQPRSASYVYASMRQKKLQIVAMMSTDNEIVTTKHIKSYMASD